MSSPTIHRDDDVVALPEAVAVIGYGNQGSSWAQNLRDSGVAVTVGTISDASRERASADGFAATSVAAAAAAAPVVCLLIPDEVMSDVIASEVAPALLPGACVVVASGYVMTFEDPPLPDGVDVVMVAPRMLGRGVRDAYQAGTGFITFTGVERDGTGGALQRALGVAKAIGGTRRGAMEMDLRGEAVLDLFIEQAISPALAKVWADGAIALLEAGIPMEAILVEFYLSGEVEFAFRSLREHGYEAQTTLHSETSQYGTLSRAEHFSDVDTLPRMQRILADIASGAFAKEWAAERAAGYPRFTELREQDPRAALTQIEADLRTRLGED